MPRVAVTSPTTDDGMMAEVEAEVRKALEFVLTRCPALPTNSSSCSGGDLSGSGVHAEDLSLPPEPRLSEPQLGHFMDANRRVGAEYTPLLLSRMFSAATTEPTVTALDIARCIRTPASPFATDWDTLVSFIHQRREEHSKAELRLQQRRKIVFDPLPRKMPHKVDVSALRSRGPPLPRGQWTPRPPTGDSAVGPTADGLGDTRHSRPLSQRSSRSRGLVAGAAPSALGVTLPRPPTQGTSRKVAGTTLPTSARRPKRDYVPFPAVTHPKWSMHYDELEAAHKKKDATDFKDVQQRKLATYDPGMARAMQDFGGSVVCCHQHGGQFTDDGAPPFVRAVVVDLAKVQRQGHFNPTISPSEGLLSHREGSTIRRKKSFLSPSLQRRSAEQERIVQSIIAYIER